MSTAMHRAIAACVQANVPVLLTGEPGEGKTATIESLARSWGMHCEALSGANREPTDFLGMPVERDGVISYGDLSWARRLNDATAGALLFLDELTTVDERVQAAMLRVIEERWVGELRLMPHVRIIAAANPADIAVNGAELRGPTANRFIHLDWVFDPDLWRHGMSVGFAGVRHDPLEAVTTSDAAHRALVHQQVVRFTELHPSLLAPGQPRDPDPAVAGGAWPSPRSWTNAAAAMSRLRPEDADARLVVLVGAVGQGAAKEYLAWQAAMDLIDPQIALARPRDVGWAGLRPDQAYVLCGAMAALALSAGTPEAWTRGVQALTIGAEMGRRDAAFPGLRTLLTARPEGSVLPPRTTAAFADLLERLGWWAPAV